MPEIYPPSPPRDGASPGFPTGPAALALRHALNNPLTAIMAEAQLLEFEPLTEDQRGAIQRILAGCRRISEITRQLGESGGEPAQG